MVANCFPVQIIKSGYTDQSGALLTIESRDPDNHDYKNILCGKIPKGYSVYHSQHVRKQHISIRRWKNDCVTINCNMWIHTGGMTLG